MKAHGVSCTRTVLHYKKYSVVSCLCCLPLYRFLIDSVLGNLCVFQSFTSGFSFYFSFTLEHLHTYSYSTQHTQQSTIFLFLFLQKQVILLPICTKTLRTYHNLKSRLVFCFFCPFYIRVIFLVRNYALIDPILSSTNSTGPGVYTHSPPPPLLLSLAFDRSIHLSRNFTFRVFVRDELDISKYYVLLNKKRSTHSHSHSLIHHPSHNDASSTKFANHYFSFLIRQCKKKNTQHLTVNNQPQKFFYFSILNTTIHIYYIFVFYYFLFSPTLLGYSLVSIFIFSILLVDPWSVPLPSTAHATHRSSSFSFSSFQYGLSFFFFFCRQDLYCFD